MSTASARGAWKNEAQTIEDLEFLAEVGVGAIAAALRVGFTDVFGLEKWCQRHDARELFSRLRQHDPMGEYQLLKKQTRQRKTCTKCKATKPLSEFYPQPHTKDGRASWCRNCVNTNRRPSQNRLVRTRARGRAITALIERHRTEFDQLLETETQRAQAEHQEVVAAAAARGQADAETARIKPGPRRHDETSTVQRLDVARCPKCHSYHDAGHPACSIDEPKAGAAS